MSGAYWERSKAWRFILSSAKLEGFSTTLCDQVWVQRRRATSAVAQSSQHLYCCKAICTNGKCLALGVSGVAAAATIFSLCLYGSSSSSSGKDLLLRQDLTQRAISCSRFRVVVVPSQTTPALKLDPEQPRDPGQSAVTERYWVPWRTRSWEAIFTALSWHPALKGTARTRHYMYLGPKYPCTCVYVNAIRLGGCFVFPSTVRNWYQVLLL